MAIARPSVGYAKSGDVNVAYSVLSDGPIDVLFVPGFLSHVDLWLDPGAQSTIERFAAFSRFIVFDKRGTGASDPVASAPPLEDRMDDIRAVLDAVGSERAAIVGTSEGAPLSLLFAATYPDRVSALALYGGMARSTEAPDYPWQPPAEALLEAGTELVMPMYGTGEMAELFAPSMAADPRGIAMYERLQRLGASPAMMGQLFMMFLDIDVRSILPAIHCPTLVMHRRGDRVVNVRNGRYLAEHIPGAKYVEFPGIDHSLMGGDTGPILDELEEFLTGVRPVSEPDRVLATVMFTDIVRSTEKASEIGDHRWKELLDEHERVIRSQLARFRGTEVKTTGDGFLATFDGPARAIHCGVAITEALRPLGLEARVGLHSGEIELRQSDVAGIAVHIASRVGGLAGSGEVLVSETVKGIVAGSGIAFEDRGEHELKGIPDRWRLFSVVAG